MSEQHDHGPGQGHGEHEHDDGQGHEPGGGPNGGGQEGRGLAAKVLTVSDGVVAGTRQDASGVALAARLSGAGFDVVDQVVVADGRETVGEAIVELAEGFAGLIVTTGGTGFGPRDLTPEGTKIVLDRQAPGLAEAMRLVNPLGRLSRAEAGTRGQALILNTPGSTRGAVECLDAVLDILPHALRLLRGDREH
jgi:molybdopterin adenylyltransferase